MMREYLWCIAISFFLLISVPAQAQTSCVDVYRLIAPMEVVSETTDYSLTPTRQFAWYNDSQCILVASGNELWLYDIQHSDNALLLAIGENKPINNVAVNPIDASIAFSLAQDPFAYLVNSEGISRSLQAVGDAITRLSFSPDGNLLALGSSNVDRENGLYYEAKVQIWNIATETFIAQITTSIDVITEITLSSDSERVLLDGFRMGYMGDEIEYWSIDTGSRIWTYDDLLRKTQWTIADPLLILSSSMNDDLLALGGLDGYHDFDEYYGQAIHLWDTRQERRILQIAIHWSSNPDVFADGVEVALNSDATLVASGTRDGVVQLWNVIDGSNAGELALDVENIAQVGFSPDDTYLAILSEDNIAIWTASPIAPVAEVRFD